MTRGDESLSVYIKNTWYTVQTFVISSVVQKPNMRDKCDSSINRGWQVHMRHGMMDDDEFDLNCTKTKHSNLLTQLKAFFSFAPKGI